GTCAELFVACRGTLLASNSGQRCASRRRILFWREIDTNLLPAKLPGAAAIAQEYFIFPNPSRRRTGRISSLPALQTERDSASGSDGAESGASFEKRCGRGGERGDAGQESRRAVRRITAGILPASGRTTARAFRAASA